MAKQVISFDEAMDSSMEASPRSRVTSQLLEGNQRYAVSDQEEKVDLTDVFDITPEKKLEWDNKGQIGLFESFNREGLGGFVPLVNPEAAWRGYTLKSAMDRLQKDTYQDPAQKEADLQTFNKFAESLAEEQYRGRSLGGDVAKGVAQLPGYMIDIFLSGGLFAGGKAAAKKALAGTLEKYVANQAVRSATQKVAGAVTGTLARTPIFTGRIAEQFQDRQINANLKFTDTGIELAKTADESPSVSFAKAMGDVTIENFSEMTGGAINKAVGHAFPKKWGKALEQLWKKTHPSETVAKLWTRAGYNGFIGEIGEERVGDLLRALTGVSDFGAGPGSTVLDRVIASIPDGDQLLVEAGVLAVPGAAHLGTQGMVSMLRKKKAVSGITPEVPQVEMNLNTPPLTELQVAQITQGMTSEAGNEQVPNEEPLDRPFVPAEPSTRPNFQQRVQEVMGKSVSRETVMASIQDKKVKEQLNMLDEQAQALDQNLRYMEKRKSKLEQSGKDPIGAANLGKIIAEQQRQFDVIDSERGDILTSVKSMLDLEGEKALTGKQVTTIALQKQLEGFKQGAKAGREITIEQLKEAKDNLREFLASTEMNPTERGRFISRKEIDEIKTPEQMQRRIPKIEQRVNEIVNERKAKETKGKIQSLLQGTKTKTEAGKPIGKYTPEIQAILDRAREITKMTREDARAAVMVNLEALGQNEAPDAARLENRLLETMAGLNKRNPAELGQILDTLDAIASAGRASKILQELDRREKQEANKLNGLVALTGGKPFDLTQKESSLKKFDKSWRVLGRSLNSSWGTLMDQLDQYSKDTKQEGGFHFKTFDTIKLEIEERFSVVELVKDLAARGQEIFELKNEYQFAKQMYKDMAETKSAVFTHSNGVPKLVELSTSQMRKRWMEFQDPTLRDTIVHPEGNAYTQEILDWIESNLSQKDKDFALAQLEFYRNYYAIVNETYRRQFGVNLPFNEFYSPIRREVEKDIIHDNPLKQEADVYMGFTPQGFKSRTANRYPLEAQSDWEVFNRHVVQMEHYRHWADMVRDMNAYFSDGEVKGAIERQFGSEMNRLIASHIKMFKTRGRRNVASWEKFVDMMRTGKIIESLGGKPAQIPKQFTGMFGFAEFVSPTEFVSGLADFARNAPQAIKTLSQSKLIQLMDGNITQEFAGLLTSESAQNFVNKPDIKAAIRFYMSFLRYGAKAANMVGGWPVYRKALAETGSPEAAMDAFEAAIVKTQPTSLLSSLSEWQTGNAFQRMATMFMSSQNKYYQRYAGVIRNAIRGRATPQQLAKVIAIHQFILPMIFQFVADGFKWDDEEQLRAAVTGPVNGIFIAGDVYEAVVRVLLNEGLEFNLERYQTKNNLLEPMDGIVKAVEALDIGNTDFEDVIDAVNKFMVYSVGPVTGLPTKLIFSTIPGASSDMMYGEEGKGVLKFLGWGPAHIDHVFDK